MLPSTNKDNLPISRSIKSFELNIYKECDFPELNLILRCMPNLRRFNIAARSSLSNSPFSATLFDGYQWEQLLTIHVPHLDTIDFYLYMTNPSRSIDSIAIIHSFKYFLTKFNDFHVAISRSQFRPNDQRKIKFIIDLLNSENPCEYFSGENVRLRAFMYSKKARHIYFLGEKMILGSLNMTSSVTIDAEKHLFYSHLKNLHLFIPLNMEVIYIPSSSPLFQNLDHLIIEFISFNTTTQRNEWDLIDKIDQEVRANNIMRFIDLSQITKLEFRPMNFINQLHVIKQILFQLQSLYMIPENVYFPFEYASKLVERFSSLVHVELRIICLGTDALLVDTLLGGLAKLIHLKIFFTYRLYIDEPCSVDYVIERRRQAFPFNICNKDEILIKIDEQLLEIYLNGCSICINIPYAT
ncbi:unnamed protein product [Rotaria sp. Silwood2]|nr:unnamed protein product [Rotaria sp. Silwood2]CAF4511908.1 unnamed protein product [Rotaria sp. Silwood2]